MSDMAVFVMTTIKRSNPLEIRSAILEALKAKDGNRA